jgi:hypothetical protein
MAQVEKAEIPTSGYECPSEDGGVAAACLMWGWPEMFPAFGFCPPDCIRNVPETL